MIDAKQMLAAQQTSIETMPLDALITYAKKYDIHQQSVNEYYLQNVQRIKAQLTTLGVDPETVRSK